MELQSIINAGIAAGLAGVGWFARQVWEAVAELRRDIHEIEVELPRSYARKEDMDKRMLRIEDMFQRIYDKLDEKADK
jgi:hypothetical protein